MALIVSSLALAGACAPREGDRTKAFTLEEQLRIGQLEGAPEYAFGQVWSVDPLPGGGFLICDGNDMSLRRYDAGGRFVGAVGRKGAGPGEYASCSDIGIDRNGGIVVSDPSNGRLVEFDSAGAPRRVIAVSVSPGLGGGDNVFFIDSAGHFWKRGWLAAEGVAENAIPNQYVILDSTGTRLDSVAVPAPGGRAGRSFMLSTSDGGYYAHPNDTIMAISRAGDLAVANPMTYTISIRPRGGAARTITRTLEPVPYGDAEHAEWEAWRELNAKRNPSYPPDPIAKVKPFLRSLRFDDSGRLWVKVHVPAEKRDIPPRPAGDPRPLFTWRERNTYDLFDVASGALLGRLVMPAATELMAVHGDRLWLRMEGASGEQQVGVFELRGAQQP